MTGRAIVGIVGPPGAGKSTFAERAAGELNARGIPTAVLPMDGFHLPQGRLVELGRRERMGAPDTFDVSGFVSTLTAIRGTRAIVRAPLFDRTVEEPVPDALEIGAEVQIVLAEGNYLLHDRDGWERVAGLLDSVVTLHLDDTVRRTRLIARHIAFGKTREQAEAWTLGPDERNAELVARSLARAPASGLRLAMD